ncbi:proline--tRNA ligase [Euryarchaeota archaeon]|jgi:prolyl-tRNA synthetase|nr:proline--tRNA ligase [Euryarchaeota archaeon]MDG1542532.1 His/Gly/Thr/Pro-type tRNA ligase C-terminal domain-containing protein [Candidatus Thalassarchaeaceae archaeon]
MGKHGKAKRGIPPKSDFNAWYPAIVEISDLVDKRYPIKGMDVWKPYGWSTMRLIDSLTRKEMEESGHQEYNFPLLVPEDLLEKENQLVSRLKAARELGVDPSELRMDEEDSGFKKEVYWVTKGGENELDIPMFLRPTSETPMYTMFSLWVRSHADLPLKTFQIVNTFRYETKQTRSFIRVREIHFFEAHTVHKDEQGATRQIEQDAEIVQRLMKSLCMPVIVSKRPVWDTFPGAWYTTAVDAVMPNGRTLQIATYHHYRDQWAQAFDLNYEDAEGNTQNCHQTTFGMSERLLGAVVGMHGDDSGLILPPSVSPYQIILMPVAAHVNEQVIPKINDIAKELRDFGFRVHVDDRDIRPGGKHYHWEIRGAPIRLELGPRDLDANKCVLSLRTGGKIEVDLENLSETINQHLDDISETLLDRSSNNISELVQKFPGISSSDSGWKLNSPIEDGIVYELAFDGNDADAEVLEKITGLALLGDCVEPYSESIPCAVTGKLTTRKQHLARMY